MSRSSCRSLQPAGSFALLSVVCVLLAASVCGCALWQGRQRAARAEAAKKALLRPLQAPRNTIELEIVFVDTLADDPLLRERLWQDVDQVAALSAETRARLRRAGFRVGQVGTTFPPALESLLKMSDCSQSATDGQSNRPQQTASSHTASGSDEPGFVVRVLALPSGTDAEIETGPIFPTRRLRLPTEGGDEVVRTFDNARCVLRVRAVAVDKGWARVEFTPEIHHGRVAPRPTPLPTGWLFRTGQEVEPLYGLRFKVNLNVNESVLVTSSSDDPLSPGFQFFRGPNESAHLQRLLLVRLARVPASEPLYEQ